jgi:N-acetylglucosaminyldiphosphoundecaprenol N-acetyl-beta-D-mannosaminyltransferase
VTLNASMLTRTFDCPALRQAIHAADLVTIDGYGIERALRKQGFSGFCRMAGIELTRELLSVSEMLGLPVFFYGGHPATADKLERRLRMIWPGMIVAAIFDGYGLESRIGETIMRCRPGLLVAGLGSPRQEIFLAKLLPHLSGTVGIGVGGALEVIAGVKKEAPRMIRAHGWEWLYRMFQEPRKLREIVNLARFWNRFLR